MFFEFTQVIHRRFEKIQKVIPVNLHELRILLVLQEEDQLSIRQIQKKLDLAHNTVSELVQHLEKLHLVRKTTDANDRRIRRIRITEEGNRVADQLKEKIMTLGYQIFRDIPGDQRDLVIQAFEILLGVLQKEMRQL